MRQVGSAVVSNKHWTSAAEEFPTPEAGFSSCNNLFRQRVNTLGGEAKFNTTLVIILHDGRGQVGFPHKETSSHHDGIPFVSETDSGGDRATDLR